MSIFGEFHVQSKQLLFIGDNVENHVTISSDSTGHILGNGGAIPVSGDVPTVANTDLIIALGGTGNDVIALDETNGALPAAILFGGAGNDMLTGGSGNDRVLGGAGNDILFGGGGNDILVGGAGDDTLTGGAGSDLHVGGAGNDLMIWNPGDGSDVFEGGSGIDTALVNGAAGDEVFTVAANGARVDFERVSPGPFSIDIGTTENLVVNMAAGNDSFTASGDLAGLIHLSVDGGAGNDTIHGSNGADVLLGGAGNDALFGGDGNDLIDGDQGTDTAFMGAGDDVFKWDQGDGSDTVDGEAGFDEMLFNASANAEIFTLSANGAGSLFTRDLGNIVMDLNSIEKVTLNALGGADTININNLGATHVNDIFLDLGVGGAGDGAADTISISDDHDLHVAVGQDGGLTVLGVSGAVVHIANFEAANDHLFINGDLFVV